MLNKVNAIHLIHRMIGSLNLIKNFKPISLKLGIKINGSGITTQRELR